jgi:NDP-sugar pyrophosphorylase family protein
MLGQFFSENEEKYNVVILAGGLGTRMGAASDHIPKALTKIGSQRAIDLIFSKFLLIARQFVVGTGWHADLLESYIRGRYSNLRLSFSQEAVPELRNNATSLLYALDSVDSRYGTIVTFCDLLILSNPQISGNSMYLAHKETQGIVGTFRHSVSTRGDTVRKVVVLDEPQRVHAIKNGVIGFFVFGNTLLLKEIVYSLARKGSLNDITTDVVSRYIAAEETRAVPVDALLEFGNETDLHKARKAWEAY